MKYGLPIFLVVVFSISTYSYFFLEDYSSKREWAAVQGAIFRTRELSKARHIEYQESLEFGMCIGILTIDRMERVWVLANAKHGERIKILPRIGDKDEYRVRISKAEFQAIIGKAELSDDVEQFLKNSIDDSVLER